MDHKRNKRTSGFGRIIIQHITINVQAGGILNVNADVQASDSADVPDEPPQAAAVQLDVPTETLAQTANTNAPNAPSSTEVRTESLRKYLMQLSGTVSSDFQSPFNELIDKLLDDIEVLNWLLASRNLDTKEFNKNHAFRLARQLREQRVLTFGIDRNLNKILEHSDSDTSFRKSLYHLDADEARIERIVTTIISKM